MSYQVLAGIAACCFAFSQVLNKILSKHSIDRADSLMMFFMVATFTFGFFLTPFVPHALPSLSTLGIIAVSTLFFLVGYYAFFHGIFLADASSFAPLFQVQAAMVGFLAFLFLGERFPVSNYLYMAVMLAGAMMVSYSEGVGKNFFSKGVLLVMAMQVLHAASNILVGFALKDVSALQLLFWEDMMIGVFASRFWPQFLEHHSAKTYLVRGAGVAAILGAVSLMILK